MPYWRLFYHIVWATKNRLDLIDPTWEKDLYGYIWGKSITWECIPHAIGGISDHIHLAISIPPKLDVATLIGRLKGSSSHHINENYAHGSFKWQSEYGVSSFSEKALASIVAYINNQKKHHTENTFNGVLEHIVQDGL
jgi:putative transposase